MPEAPSSAQTPAHRRALRGVVRSVVRVPQRVLTGLVHGYRLLLKPWIGNACRFEPTCSAYALQALQQHGALRGSALTGWRILRCQPWCDGGCDPVPEHFSHPAAGLFTRLGLAPSRARPEPPDPPPEIRKFP